MENMEFYQKRHLTKVFLTKFFSDHFSFDFVFSTFLNTNGPFKMVHLLFHSSIKSFLFSFVRSNTLIQKSIFCPKNRENILLGWLIFYRLGWVEFYRFKFKNRFWLTFRLFVYFSAFFFTFQLLVYFSVTCLLFSDLLSFQLLFSFQLFV